MKNIDTTQIVEPTSLQPFTGNSLRFLQDSQDEARAAVIKALITSTTGSYDLTTPYVISGCVLTDADATISAGEIFFGGFFFQTTDITSAANTPIQFVLTQTQDPTADPLEFTDNAMKNVHNIFTYVATDTATPQAFDATDLVSVYGAAKTTFENRSANQATTSTSYIDLTGSIYTTPNDGATRTWLILAKSNLVFQTGGVTGDGGAVQIYNLTTTTGLDESGAFNLSASTVTDTTACVAGQDIVSLAPNTTIKIRIRSSAGISVNFTNNSFIMVEI